MMLIGRKERGIRPPMSPPGRSRRQLACSAAAILIATPACADSLADAVALAYAGNPAIRAARANQRAVDEGYVQARARYGPQVQASVGETYERVHARAFGDFESTGPTGSLSITQPLYTGGRLRAALSVAEADIESQREQLRQTELDTFLQVATAFVAVRRDLAALAAYEDTVQALDRQLQQVKAEFGVRRVTRTDVDQTEGRLALASANAISARAQIEISRSRYQQAVGQFPGALDPEPALATMATLDEAFDVAERLNPALAGARAAEAAGRARVAAARAAYRPSISAEVNVSQGPVQAFNQALGDQTAVTAGLALSQPLYTSGLNASAVRQALAQADAALAQVEVARRAAIQRVSEAWSRLVAARLSLKADETRLSATEKAFYGVRQEQPFDFRTPIEVLNAEQELNDAQVRFLQDRYAEYVARVELLVATGALTPQMLSPGVPTITGDPGFRRAKDRGGPPWIDAVRMVDGIGAPSSRAAPLIAAPAAERGSAPTLPPAPVDAAALPPLRTATSLMSDAKDR